MDMHWYGMVAQHAVVDCVIDSVAFGGVRMNKYSKTREYVETSGWAICACNFCGFMQFSPSQFVDLVSA